MTFSFSGISRLTARAGAAFASLAAATAAMAADIPGQPVDKAIDLQPGVTQIRAHQLFFYNWIVSPIIIGVAAFILVLLAIVILRFNKRANPEPARFSHNT